MPEEMSFMRLLRQVTRGVKEKKVTKEQFTQFSKELEKYLQENEKKILSFETNKTFKNLMQKMMGDVRLSVKKVSEFWPAEDIKKVDEALDILRKIDTFFLATTGGLGASSQETAQIITKDEGIYFDLERMVGAVKDKKIEPGDFEKGLSIRLNQVQQIYNEYVQKSDYQEYGEVYFLVMESMHKFSQGIIEMAKFLEDKDKKHLDSGLDQARSADDLLMKAESMTLGALKGGFSTDLGIG